MTTGEVPTAEHAHAAAPRVLAALVRRGAELDEAEDALQEALLAAAQQWPHDGAPDDPTAWLITVARRRWIDEVRASAARRDRETAANRFDTDGSAVRDTDDSLAMLLLCCHPALPRASQVALTLRSVAGLSTAQIARGFLVPEATMAQRLSRARARLRETDARFGDVTAADLPSRVSAVLQVLHLTFTEGHTATTGPGLVTVSLSAEAVRIARSLHERLPAEPEVAGLLALMLLSDARRAARTGPDGALVTLEEQDRSRWDRAAIAEGVALVEQVLPVGRVGPFQLQAAIAAVHGEARRAGDTDWPQIEALYRMLLAIEAGPMVALNHAVAVAMVDGPAAGLALLPPLDDDRALRRHPRLHAVRAHLLERDGQFAAAADSYRQAARLTTSGPEQSYLNRREANIRDRLGGPSGPGSALSCE